MSRHSLLDRYREVLKQVIEFDYSQFECVQLDLAEMQECLESVRQTIAAIDSMTPDEKQHPTKVLDAERLRRIARGCGVSTSQLAELLEPICQNAERFAKAYDQYDAAVREMRRTSETSPSRPQSSVPFADELCERTHATMLAGVCPWCGGEITSFHSDSEDCPQDV